ncbi:hypothetical protein NS354_06430 [Leucobacter chromiiresistens]|uniref:Uncharacterized protein n=1 Tax=Leucobacter chromiiresistens TaxID=1079994 RepID=A0A147ENS6_9MICO|nr:hypothetical protein NS354_06430 [Leucobacter chromiiresistens]
MTFSLVVAVMATLAGAVHAIMVCLALQGVIRIENAELAAWCSRAIRPTFQVFAPLAAAHYVLHGYDHGLILTTGYCVAMGVFLMK